MPAYVMVFVRLNTSKFKEVLICSEKGNCLVRRTSVRYVFGRRRVPIPRNGTRLEPPKPLIVPPVKAKFAGRPAEAICAALNPAVTPSDSVTGAPVEIVVISANCQLLISILLNRSVLLVNTGE